MSEGAAGARRTGASFAYYLWPPRWVGEKPSWAEDPDLPAEPADLADVTLEADLPSGIRVRAFRDGMLAFDFASWPDPSIGLGDSQRSFDAAFDYQARCVRVINAHLACLQTSYLADLAVDVVTPNHLVRVMFTDGSFGYGAGEGPPMAFELGRARHEPFEWTDWRIQRGGFVIRAEKLDRSFDLLRQLLARPNQDLALLRAELLFRSAVAYRDHDNSAALVTAWTVAEGLMGDLFAAYLDDCQDRPIDVPGTFINADRRRFLEGPELTARITAEVLSLADRMPFRLYRRIRRSTKARNDWLHSQEEVTHEDVVEAFGAALELFELVEGVGLRMGLSRSLN